MKIKTFTYYKEKEGTSKEYRVLTVKEDDTYIEGVSLLGLTEDQQNEVMDIYLEFEKKLQPFMKEWRKFKKSAVLRYQE